MKVDFSTVLLDLKGEPMLEKAAGSTEPQALTLGAVVVGAASSSMQGMNAATSLKRFKLAVLASHGDVQEVPDDMLDEIRRAVHARFQGNPIVYGRLCEIIGEPKAPEAKPAQPARPVPVRPVRELARPAKR